MDDILQKHPEITKFKEDQKLISHPVINYIEILKNTFPENFEGINNFAKAFSQIDEITDSSIDNLSSIPNWTFNTTKKDQAMTHIRKLIKNYPVAQVIKGKVKTGEYLDLRNEEDNENFIARLDKFASRIDSIQTPSPVEFDTDKIGDLEIKIVHDLKSHRDPILGERLAQVLTLDPSTNPGTSVKDIMAKQMIQDAIESSALRHGMTIVEGTSGNTGAGLAIIAANLGYKIILIIPDKMSQEKIDRLRYLGAHVIVTPTSVAANDTKSYYSVRDYMTETIKGWTPWQYHNLSNRKAHEEVTGPMLWDKTNGDITAVVISAGTCGTVSGIARFLKKKNPNIKVIAVDTIGSILYLLKEGYSIEDVEQYATGYLIQGFGEDIHPKNLDLDVIDHFIRIGDATGFAMTRLLVANGFPYGHSSGATFAAMLEAIDEGILEKEDKVLCIFPDSGLPYRKDVYNDEWLKLKGFANLWS